jgi:ATP phosphoribosyltransferase regulatory subunit
MNSALNIANLLPSGLMDSLPPLAAQEFKLIHRFLKLAMGFGYAPVHPPLLEFADTLLAGQGAATSHHSFQVLDPLSNRMLALRADITTQLSRIAAGSLKAASRPLRLCYAGYSVRTLPEALAIRRQHLQLGLEQIGAPERIADAEMIALSCHLLKQYPIGTLTVDISYPSLLPALLADFPAEIHASLAQAVANKDTAQLRALGAPILADILTASGAYARAIPALRTLAHPVLHRALDDIEGMVARLSQTKTEISLVIDLLEAGGYSYYSGIAYALYASNPALLLARGGRYESQGETAVGITYYLQELVPHLPAETEAPLLAVPHTLSCAEAETLQAKGYRTVFIEEGAAAPSGVGLKYSNGKINEA